MLPMNGISGSPPTLATEEAARIKISLSWRYTGWQTRSSDIKLAETTSTTDTAASKSRKLEEQDSPWRTPAVGSLALEATMKATNAWTSWMMLSNGKTKKSRSYACRQSVKSGWMRVLIPANRADPLLYGGSVVQWCHCNAISASDPKGATCLNSEQ